MAHKQIHFRAEAREKILKGAAALADAVRVTLGPKSKSVLIDLGCVFAVTVPLFFVASAFEFLSPWNL